KLHLATFVSNRPLSKRAEGGRVIVEVDDKVAKVRNIKVDSRLDSSWESREKTVAFSFDYCYWSVDPEDPKYASQEMVFQDLGTSVLSGAFRGYNICLFAYGQTGSGKTYTMMGTPASIGLTPRICEVLSEFNFPFFLFLFSFLEIYNERVRDLLKQSDKTKPYTLRVREHPETGPYVQGLTQHLVTDYKQVVKLLEEGIAKRITAATHIHNASSRSHAVFTIHYTQAILENNLPSEIASKINLVDLAGSERADPSYCKDRITEGANINKSLVTLGIVISTLAQNSQMFSSCQSITSITSEAESGRGDNPPSGSSSGRRPAYIPYRDSILTWLLKDSLGGNSKTIMIATISPASSSYNETMSTLRYAANAKNIINKPRVNEDANVKLIRELREEIDRLKAMLMSFELIEQLTKDWTSKWTDRKAIMEEYSVDINKEKAGVTIDSNLPHLMAMDDDILSTGVVLYHLREGTTKIGRSDSDQDQDIVLQGQWIERNHCLIENHCGIVTLRPVPGARCSVNGSEVSGSCRLSQGALVVLGKSHKFRFNHPAEAAILRLRRSINETPPTLSCGALDWLNLDGSCINSPHYILSSLYKEIDAVHEEYKQKLRDQEAFHRKQIQRQQLYVENLKQQILKGQIKAEQELENDQALINQQIQENQQWLINENKRLAALQQQQREFAVQTESTLCAEAEVQSTTGLETCLSLLQQNKKRLVQLELLQRYSLKKAERNIRRKKVKFRLERIVKKQKLLEAKQNLEQLEASCWLSEECGKQPQVPSDNIDVWSSLDHHLQKRQKSLGLSSSQHSDDLNDEKGISFSIQRQLTKKQKGCSIKNKKEAEEDTNDSPVMAYINKNYKKIEKLDDSPGQAGSQNQTSKCSSPDLSKEKDEPKTFITGRRMTKSKVLGDLSQPATTSVGNLTKVNSQTPLSYVEKKWHSAEILSAGVSKTATDVLGNWQEDEENEISDTDSSYSVDSLSCAYAKAFPEKPKLEDFDRNKCLANPEDSESDDSQMSQDSLIEKENKAKNQNASQFHKLKAHHEPSKLYKSRTENHISSLVTSYASHRRLGKAERSFSLDSLADGEEMPAEDLVEESRSDSSDEVPAEIFWKLQTPKLPATQGEEDHESKICDRDTEGTSCDLKLSSSFYLNAKVQTASSNACKQLLKGAKVSYVEQERSLERGLYYTSGNPLLTNDAWSSCDSKVDTSNPSITASSSHENLEFQDAHLCSLSKPELWLKKDDLKQSAAEVSFVSGSKQIHSITRSPHHVNQINSIFSSDTLEVPLPETTTTASGASESRSLNKIFRGWTNSNENSSLESQNVMSSFVSSVGPSSSFVPTSAEHDYYEHSRSQHPEEEQLGELSAYRSATECAETFSCVESTSMADCLSLVSKKVETSLPTTHPELPKDHTLKKIPFISVLPMQIVEQRNGCVGADLEDDLVQTFSKDELDNDYNNLMTKSSVTDSGSGRASVSAPDAECSMGLAHNMTSTQTTAVKHIQFGNCGQLFPVQKLPTCCDEGFFLSDLTNKNCSLVSTYKLQTLAGQGSESADTEEPPRSGESNLETMQERDHKQTPAEVTAETHFSSQKTTYQCHPLVVVASASYDQSATPIEMSQKERLCMEISTDSLADIVPEVPSFSDHGEYISKDEGLSSLNHYEFKHKPDSKDYSPACALADNQTSCLSQQISETYSLCTDNIREESSESKEHNVLNSQAEVQKEFSSKYKNQVVNEVSCFLLNVNGKNTKSFPAAICENTNDFLPESNSSLFYKVSTKANLFQSASEAENYDKLLEHVRIMKGECDATSNLTVEVSVTESCSDAHSGCLCPTCSSKSTGQKNTTHKTIDISAEFDASILLETKTQNKSLLESREEKEAFFESHCPEDIFHVEHDSNTELGRVSECNTNASAAISQEDSSYKNKEPKFFRNKEMDTEEAMAPYQNTGTARDEEILKSINNPSNLEKSALEKCIKSRNTESLPDSPVAQSVTEDRSGKDLKDIGLNQNPEKPTDISACEVLLNTNLCLTHEEVDKDELQEASTGAEHTQESKALAHSDSQLKTSSFCQKEKSEKVEIGFYSAELSVASKTTPSPVCSHTTDIIQNTLGFLDTCKGLLQINGTTENVAGTVLIPRSQGNISAKLENERQITSNSLIEHCVPNCLPQEDEVNECKVTGSEEQNTMTNAEELVIMRQEDICTEENVYFNEQSPALSQMYGHRGDKEEILDQFKIPERYLMASEVEPNSLLEDDSRYHDPSDMSEDGDSVDSAAEIGNVIDACEYPVDDSAGIDQQRTEQKFTSLDRHRYMSHSVQSPEHGTSENLNVGINRISSDICELDQVGSRAEEEKVQLMKLVEMAKANKQKQILVENTEEVELIFLQNLDELFPENKGSYQITHDDSRLNEILRESQWISTSFSGNNEDISKQQNPPASQRCTEKNQELQDTPSQSVSQPVYLGGSDDSHLVQDVPATLKGCIKPSNSSRGTGTVLPYHKETEIGVGASVTANKTGEDEHLPGKTQSRSVALLQTTTMQQRQEEESSVFKNGPDDAMSVQPVNENSSFTPYRAGGLESGTVVLQQRAEGSSFFLEKLNSSEDIIQDINNAYEEHRMDLMVNKLLNYCLNSIEDTAQEVKDITVPDSQVLDTLNLLSSSEKQVIEDIGVGKTHALLESSTQKKFQNINTTQKVPHLGGSSLHDEKTFLSASYPTANSKCENAEFPGVAGYQHEPTENQEHEASEECCVDQSHNTVSEKDSALSEGLNKSPKENPHYGNEFLNYNRNLGTSECSPGFLNCPVPSAGSLIVSSGDKGKNDTVLSEETKYFESESTNLSVSVTFPGVSQIGDGKENNYAVAEATYAQSNKLPEKVVGTEQKEKIVQGYFQNCDDIKEDKIHGFSEQCSNTNSVTVPESGLLTFQSQGQTGCNEPKALPSHSAEHTPAGTTFQSSKNFGAFNTSSFLGDSKSLVFSQLEDSLQDSCLTEKVSCNPADVCSVKEGDFSQSFARVNYPTLTAFSEFPLTANIGHGETSTYGTSHSNTLKQSPFAVLQIQDTQSDKAVVFDEPVCASGSILLSLAKENRHFPMSDIDCTSYKNSALDGEPAHGSNSKKTDSDTKIDQHNWDKVPPQETCNKHIEKIANDNSLLLPSLPVWDTTRAIPIKEGQIRNTLNESKEELHSNPEAEHFAVKTEQTNTLSREPAEKQSIVSSNSPSELTGSEVTVLENLYPRDVQVDREDTCNSFSQAYPTYRSPDPRQLYHTVLGFERNPADLQDNRQYVPAGEQIEQVPDKTNTDGRKEILLCKNMCSSIDSPAADAEANTCSTMGDTIMRSSTLKSERLNFSVKNNETTSIKFLPENHDLTPQESKLVQFRSKRSYSTTRSAKGYKQSERRPYLQSHRVSAPAIAVFSDTEYALEASKADPVLYSASKSLQDLNMSVEPPSPTEDDFYGIERFSKQESKNFLQVKCKPRFQQKMAQTKKITNCDPKNVQNFTARSQSSQSPSSLQPSARSSVCAEANIHSKSSSVAQCSEGKGEEAGYQPETDLFLQDNKDVMHFRSSDINPYIHPWQQDGACKIGWKQYVFGSASDVSCNQIPLNIENRKVMRCSSVDNGLNSQNSPFHSHLSSYATAKVLSSTLSSIEGLQEWDSNPSAQPGNSSMQVDEIVLLYPSESEKPPKKPPGITCEQGTQTASTGRYKRQRRHQRSYTDVSAKKEETNRDLFHQPSSWTSMQNLSMHLSQLLQNTSELLGNLSQQSMIDNEQNAKINQKGTEGAVRSDSCTQTTADVGTQTEILEKPQSRHEEKQVEAKMEKELRAAQAVNVDWKEIGADTVGEIPKRKEETSSLEERTQEQTGMKSLDSFMHLPLPKISTPTLHSQKTPLNAQQNVAFASTRASPLTSSLPSSGQDGSSCTVVSSPTNSTSPTSCTQDKRSISETETPAERKFWYKNTLLVDRASSPILTLSASPSSQTAFRKSVCPIKEPLGYSSVASSPLHTQRKLRAGPQFSMQHHVDSFSQTETDSESSTSREHKSIRKKSGTFSDKKVAKELLGQDGSKDLEQQHRLRVDTHTTICAERLYHSSSTLEVSGHSEVVTGDVRDQGSVAHSLHCMYVTRGGRGSLGGTEHEKYTGNSDAALIHNYPSPSADLFFNQKINATCSRRTNAGKFSEPLVEASSLQFHDFFWKNENSCPPPLSDVSDVQTSFRDDSTDSVTGSECDTEIPLSKNTTCAKPYRPRSYSLRDLPIHNKFSNWCGVKSSPPPLLLGLSGSMTDLRSQRAQIMSSIHLDLHQHPLTVELTEAKLNYGIGETDALLRVLQRGTADEPGAIPVKQQLYERHMRTIETLRKERVKRLQRYQRSRSLSPQKHLSLSQTLDASQKDLDLPSRRREYLQKLRRDVVENTRVQEPKRRSVQHPSDIELLLRDYQRAREETKTEIARARDKLRERAEQEKRRIREQIFSQLQKEEARLKTLASTSTLCTDSSLSLSSGPTSGYNSSNTATYTASNFSSQEGQVMAACSHNLRNLYTCQAAAGWKYQCTEEEVQVYYKVFPSATRHGFLGAGVIERPLPYVWGLVRDPGKRHLYDSSINTARIHKKVTSHIHLVYLVTDTSLCYLKQPRDFCCITVEAKEENLSVLAIQSVYDASMPHPCKEAVRGEILPSAWILEPDIVNGREITRVIYMAQVRIFLTCSQALTVFKAASLDIMLFCKGL
uniref:StAR-related lipid transfer protein 9 n=1 Tax=Catharus ustulatus TaxID=91951 RepID=A0A8C3TWV7_CATUS